MNRKDMKYLASRFSEMSQVKEGSWVFPYKHPRGTKAVKVERVDEKDIVHLSDGSSMHRSHARLASEGEVAK